MDVLEPATPPSQSVMGSSGTARDAGRDADWLRRIVPLATAVSLLLSHRLWLTTRGYPLTPVWSGLRQPPPPLDGLLLAFQLIALVAAALLAAPRWPLRIACGVAVLWCALDQSRWQPWFVQYVALMAGLLLVPWERRAGWRTGDLESALIPAQLLVACTYFYAGAQKLNHEFATSLYPWTVEPLLRWLHLDAARLPVAALAVPALASALAECAAGIGLLVPRLRRLSALFLISMHGFIMLMIGPLGRHWNIIVWPWNLAMMGVIPCLFLLRRAQSGATLNSLFRRLRPPAADGPCPPGAGGADRRVAGATVLSLILFGLLPALSFVNRWDSYLSFCLYSGNLRQAYIRVDPSDVAFLPASARRLVSDDGVIDPFAWSVAELRVVSYPEDRIAINIARALARRGVRHPIEVRLEGKPNLWTGKRALRFVLCPVGGGPAEEEPPEAE